MVKTTTTYEMVSYELADIRTRAFAWFVDGVILFMMQRAGSFTTREVVLISLAYSWFFLTRNNGQTLGKVLMNIRVIKTDGTSINDGDAVIRYIGTIINFIGCIGWLWALLDANRQGWHDKLAHTFVVKAE